MTFLYFLIYITCFVQFAFYVFIYTKFLRYSIQDTKLNNEDCKPVSIVICARNESENLQQFIPLFFQQDYPAKYELIVIDDGSTDDTPQILNKFESQYPNFLSFRIDDKQHPGKKQALSNGIALSKHEFIAVTDADCYPVSKDWLKLMMEPLNAGADVVLGISPFIKTKSWINRFFRMEAISVALQYINFTLTGVPFMGVGRNMAYRKSTFESYNIDDHWDLVSGDDDLFVNAVIEQSEIKVVVDPSAFTISNAPLNIRQWFNQKLRHYTTGYHYNLVQKIWLGYYWLSSLLLYALLLIVLAFIIMHFPVKPLAITALFGVAILRWIITLLSIRKLGESIKWSIPLLDLLYILSVWVISPLSRVTKFRWK